MTEKWYDNTPEQIALKLNSSVYNGLSKKTAAARLRHHGKNVLYPVPLGPFYIYLKHVLTDFTSILLIVTSLMALLFKQNVSAAILIGIQVTNIAAAVIIYVKAHRVLEGMVGYALPTAKVIREGKLYLVKQELLVPGDIIYISAGDIVPADARLIESNKLTVLENSLTGETQSAQKDASFIEYRDLPLSGRKNMVYASTVVTRGSGKAIVCEAGENTLAFAMEKITPIVSHEQLTVFKVLKKYCSVWSVCMIVMIFALSVLNLVFGYETRGLFDIFLTGLTLAVASMSEFYTAFGYIVVACGIFNAARRQRDINSGALIKNTVKISTLKEISCLVIPKEALFSIRNSDVERIVANGVSMNSDMRGFTANSAAVLRYAVISTGIYGGNRLVANNLRNENVYSHEEDAIIAVAQKCGLYNMKLDELYPILDHLPLSSANRFETTLIEYGNQGNNVAVVRGDAQSVLGICAYYSENGHVFPMDHEKLNDFRITASLITKETFRVIAVATKSTSYNNLTRIVSCQTDMTLEGFLCIREKMLPGAAVNISRCHAANVKVIMTCDDINDNNRYIANALGIIRSDDEITTSHYLATLKKGLFRANVQIYRLYQGLNENQKIRVIRYLKDSGEVVGVLARDLDEVALLREADAGFSQSVTISSKALKTGVDMTDRSISVYSNNPKTGMKTGCDAVKFLSDVIVSEPEKSGWGGFNAMVNSMAYSKVIYMNLLRTVRYLLASQTVRFFIVLYAILTNTVLLNPVQLLFCGLIIDFTAVIVIAFERPASNILSIHENTEKKLHRPFRHNAESVLIGMVPAVITACVPLLLKRMNISVDALTLSSSVFCGVILAQFVLLDEIKKDRSIFVSVSFNRVYGLVLLLTVLFVISGQLMPQIGLLFGIVRPTLPYVLITLLYPVLMLTVFETYKLVRSGLKMNRKKRKKSETKPASAVKSFFSSGFPIIDPEDDSETENETSANK